MFSRLTNYLKETRQELRKVNWPTRTQTIQYTILVIVISVGVAIFLGVIDYVLKLIFNKFIFHI
ncbi:MAG: preprotein translocase subunit SecE [Patescibacteria group bacterium]